MSIDEGEILYHHYLIKSDPTLEARTGPPINQDQQRVLDKLFTNHNGSIPSYEKHLSSTLSKKGGAIEVAFALAEEQRLLRLLQKTINQYREPKKENHLNT